MEAPENILYLAVCNNTPTPTENVIKFKLK